MKQFEQTHGGNFRQNKIQIKFPEAGLCLECLRRDQCGWSKIYKGQSIMKCNQKEHETTKLFTIKLLHMLKKPTLLFLNKIINFGTHKKIRSPQL